MYELTVTVKGRKPDKLADAAIEALEMLKRHGGSTVSLITNSINTRVNIVRVEQEKQDEAD